MMTPEPTAFLNALVPATGETTTDHTEAIYGLLEPLHGVLDRVEGHVSEIDRLRRAADRAEENPAVYGWFERFKQSIDAARRLNTDAKRAVEALSDLAFQMDAYAVSMRDTLNAKATTPSAPLTVHMTVGERDHLLATVDEANARLGEALARVAQLEER